MKKIVLLSIALITVGFLAAVAQNNIPLPEKYQRENGGFEYPDFETSKLPAIKKTKSGQDWWEPDTVYAITIAGENRKDERLINKYNSHGLFKERIRQRWINNSWVNEVSSSYAYTYDSNNNVLTCSGPNQTTYTYDSNNNILTEQIRIRENDLWVNYMLNIYTYDSNNNMLTHLKRLWNNSSWLDNQFNTYTYDSNNNMLTHLSQDSPQENSYSSLTTYTYDSNNNLLTELIQRWQNNSWVNAALRTYIYDSDNNQLTKKLAQIRGNNSWENYELSTYSYDSNNNMPTEKLVQDWRNNSWVNREQYLMTYDENRNGTSVEYWFWIKESWQSIGEIVTETILYYNNMQSNFRWGCHKLTASYINVADIGAAIAESPVTPELNDVSVYPNPTIGKLRITDYGLRITGVRIFDISGVHLFNTQQTTLDISHLPAGIYFVQITTENGVVTRKIVKL